MDSMQLSAGHARALAALDDRAFAEHVAKRAVDEGWSVRQIEEAVRHSASLIAAKPEDPESHAQLAYYYFMQNKLMK